MLSRVWLFATPWTVALQAPLSMGFPRRECWSGLPFPTPGDLPDRDWTWVSANSLALCHLGSPLLAVLIDITSHSAFPIWLGYRSNQFYSCSTHWAPSYPYRSKERVSGMVFWICGRHVCSIPFFLPWVRIGWKVSLIWFCFSQWFHVSTKWSLLTFHVGYWQQWFVSRSVLCF